MPKNTLTRDLLVARQIPPRTGSWTLFKSLMRWNIAQNGAMLPLFIVVQALMAGAIIVGFGFLIPETGTATVQFLSSGAPVVMIMVIGFVLCPMGVAQARTKGTLTYLRALPVPRGLHFLSDLFVWIVIALPAVPVTVLVSYLRYGFSYSFDWPLLISATILITIMATSVGYALAVILPPAVAQLVTQVLVFFIMLFSPVTFPASQLPAWFQQVHEFLPFGAAADMLRAGLLSDTFSPEVSDLVVLLVWTIVGVVLSIRALVRRQ